MPIEAKTKNKKKKKRKKVLRDGQISEVFSKSQTGGSPRGVSVPFQNRPVFLCSHKFSLFVPCPTYLVITPPPSPPPSTFTCCLVPYYFVTFPNIFFLCSLISPNPEESLSFILSKESKHVVSYQRATLLNLSKD